VYLRKPEVFKMACLRDILNLFGAKHNPFYAGFGNRLTDALSYRSVNIPSTRIFTINSYAEVSLDLLTLTKYKSSYVNMRDLVDHFFPPVGLLSTDEQYTDFNYWRDPVPDPEEFSDSEDEGAGEEDEDEDGGDSYYEEHGELAERYMENAYGEDEYDEDEEEDVEEDGYEEEEDEEYDEESEMAEGEVEQHPTDVQTERELGAVAKTEEKTESKIPFVGGKMSGMKMDLDTSRLVQAKEFAERELSGIVGEVVSEIKALTTDSSKPEVENKGQEEIGVSA